MICEATGWKCFLVAGGPEPAHEGRLNTVRYASTLLIHGNIQLTELQCVLWHDQRGCTCHFRDRRAPSIQASYYADLC